MNLKFNIFFLVLFILVSSKLFSQNDTNKTLKKFTIDNSEVFYIESKNVINQKYKINVFIPESYEKTDKKYPVVYLLDGDLLFGMATDIQLGMRWGAHLPEVFIVGIGYGPRTENKRRIDFVPKYSENDGRGDKFLDFLKDELIPTIESNYRVDSQNCTLYGYSLGGMFCLYSLFTYPDLFTNYIAASYTINRKIFSIIDYEEMYYKKRNKLAANLYISAREYESPEILSFAHKIESRNYSGLNLFIVEHPGTGHYTTGNSNSLVFG